MLDAAGLIADAEAQVGIADSEPAIAQNLRALLSSVAADFPLSPAGETMVREQITMDLVNRLEGLKWFAAYPEVADEPIDAPVFLMGLPRSGTTYFQYLFDRDHRFRLIRTWESSSPLPPAGYDPASVETRRAAWRAARARRDVPEQFAALHLYDDGGSDECHAFLEQSFGAAGLHNLLRVPGYFDYILDELDLQLTYRVHKRMLQLLQWRQERRPWALKYPNYVVGLPELLAVYPDARMVMTHRDPLQVVGSIAKMTYNLRGMRSAGPVDPHEVGRDMLHFIRRHVDRIMAFDASEAGARVIHVDYYALVQDPVRELRAIHQGLGIDTPDDVAQAVGDWHAANPKNARGANDYSLAQYGLEQDEVAAIFAPYAERFAIPTEAHGLARTAVSA